MKLYWCKTRKEWVEPEDYVPQSRVHLQSDMEAIESPITGEVIGSRGQYAEHLKHFGAHVAEPGDVPKRQTPDRAGIRRDVKRTLQDMGVVG